MQGADTVPDALLGSQFAGLDAPPGGRVPTPPTNPSRFRLLDDSEIMATGLGRAMVVQEVLPADALVLMVGPPSSCKTFAALDLALSIATGADWHGRAVLQGSVVYVSGEGRAGLPQRVAAWKHRHGIEGPLGVRFLLEPVQLLDDEEVRQFLRVVADITDLRLIIFDTLARCMVGGDENSAKDVGKVIAALDRIRRETGATVVLIHHTGRDGKQERGSTALRGAADVQVRLGLRGPQVVVDCVKMKDAAPFRGISFRQEVIDLGDSGSSCVLVSVGHKAAPGASGGGAGPDRAVTVSDGTHHALEDRDVQMLDVLRSLGPEGATQTEWRRAVAGEGPEPQESTFRKAIQPLVDGRYVLRDPPPRGRYRLSTQAAEGRSDGH